MRHDWNSLISDDESLLLKHYTKQFFPPADDMVPDFQIVLCIQLFPVLSYNTSSLVKCNSCL